MSRRKLLTLRQLYPRAPSRPSVSPCHMGRSSVSTSLMPQLVQVVTPPQHGAFVASKGSVNLLRISYVSLTSLHIRRDASAEKDPPAGLSSIHNLTLGKV